LNKKQYKKHIENLGVESIEIDEVIQRLNPIFKKISKEEQQELNKWEK